MSENSIGNPLKKLRCVRCLLNAIDDKTALEIVNKYKADTPECDRALPDIYRQRLDTCLDCKYLERGVCLKCGYYVEARMYRKGGRCPLKLF